MREGKPNSKDNKKLRQLLTKKPKYWKRNEHGIPVLAIFHKKKVKGKKSKLSRDSVLHTLGKLMHVRNLFFASFFRMLFSQSLLNQGETVLDIGCGTSDNREFFYRNLLHVNYVGIELSSTAIEVAISRQSRAPYLYLQHDFNEAIPLRSNSFDLIIFTEAIEHVSKRSGIKCLAECYRLLKPEGILYLATPDSEYSGDMCESVHVYEYTCKELKREIKKAGFVLERVQGNTIKPKDLKRCISVKHQRLYNKLKMDLPTAYLRNIFASLYPDESYAKAYICRKSGLKRKRRKH